MNGTEEKKQSYVFISYSSQRAAEANSVRKLLEGEGIRCWMAPKDIPAGSEYADVLVKALKECACLVLVLTREAQGSQWVAKEVERAINYNKPILTAQLEELELSGKFEFYIGDRQIVRVEKLAPEDEGFRRIVAGIRGLTGVTAPTVLPRRQSPKPKSGKPVQISWSPKDDLYGGNVGDAWTGYLSLDVPALAKTDKGYEIPEFLCRVDERGKAKPICAAEWGPDGPMELYCVDADGKETPWEQETDIDWEDPSLKTKSLYLLHRDQYGSKSFFKVHAFGPAALRIHREFHRGDPVVAWGGTKRVGRTDHYNIYTILHLAEDPNPGEKPDPEEKP